MGAHAVVLVVLAAMCFSTSSAFAKKQPRVLTPSSNGISAEDADRLAEGLRAAAMSWSYPQIPCTSIELSVARPVRGRLAQRDDVNLVVFRSGPWCHNERCGRLTTYPIRAAAMTTTYPPRAGVRLVEEADIELNAAHFAWFGAAGPAQRKAPVEEVLVHELGHALGFDDLCLTDAREPLNECSAEERGSVMRPGSGRTTLSDYDIRALCAAYPRAPDHPSKDEGNRTAWRLAVPAAAILALAYYFLRRRST